MVRQPALAMLLVLSILAIGMCLLRTVYTADFAYAYMVINLMLAWVPLMISFTIGQLHTRQKPTVAGLSILWLLFFPNTFYLVTDFIHLIPRPMIPVWFDAAMLTIFSVVGVALGFFSLYIMERALHRYIHRELFTVSIFFITSFGIYIGRFLRWNSWDVFVFPIAVALDIVESLAEPFAWAFSLGATLLLLFTYYVFRPALYLSVNK